MSTFIQSGLSASASELFPSVATAPTGTLLVNVDCCCSIQSISKSSLGRFFTRPPHWMLESEWATQQIPLGTYHLRIAHPPIELQSGECHAPMGVILIARAMCILTGQPDPWSHKEVTGDGHIRHFQYTDGLDATVYSMVRDHLVLFGCYKNADTLPETLYVPCMTTPLPA